MPKYDAQASSLGTQRYLSTGNTQEKTAVDIMSLLHESILTFASKNENLKITVRTWSLQNEPPPRSFQGEPSVPELAWLQFSSRLHLAIDTVSTKVEIMVQKGHLTWGQQDALCNMSRARTPQNLARKGMPPTT